MRTGTLWRFICRCGREHEYRRRVVAVDWINEAEDHLRRLVDWGHGEDAPDDARRDWGAARAFLARSRPGEDAQ